LWAALGHPRTLVEKARGFAERSEVDGHRAPARSLESSNGVHEGLFGILVPEEDEIVSARDSEAKARGSETRREAALVRAGGARCSNGPSCSRNIGAAVCRSVTLFSSTAWDFPP
jgi:hypothetical protein